ncbi:MAG: STAS domain-containing protein [Methanobacterium sp.]|uniref:STAS domain-containing protein n=1 Tax=Methanobacterium sp. TaxID=2164 RepID=UPI003D649C50|nr:STAS domain-containing protein [Methanobacterium sp.]
MEIGKKSVDNVEIIPLNGRLDAYSSSQVEKTINSLIEDGKIKIVVNFKEIEYISSSGLRVMLASLKKLKKINGDIKLACLKPYVLEVFEIAGFTHLFDIYESEEEAVNSLQ